MYFLSHIKKQFFAQIFFYREDVENTSGQTTDPKLPVDQREGLTQAQRTKLESLEAIKSEIDGLQAGEKYLRNAIIKIEFEAKRIKEHPTPAASPSDPDYAKLMDFLDMFLRKYAATGQEVAEMDETLKAALAELEGHIDTNISQISGLVDEKDFSQDEISDLEGKREIERKKAEASFASYREEHPEAPQDFKGTPLEANFQAYQKVLADTGKADLTHVNTKGQIFAYDIEEFGRIANENTILMRDAQKIGAESFGALREIAASASYEALQKSTDPKILDLISVEKDGKREFTPFAELSADQVLKLKEAGYDTKQLYFVDTSGKALTGPLQVGQSFVVNFGTNQGLTDTLGLHLFDNTASTIRVEGQDANYQANGPEGEGYYIGESRIDLADGMKIEVLSLRDTESPSPSTSTEAQDIMTQATQTRVYQEALQSGQAPLDTTKFPPGLLGQIQAMLTAFFTGKPIRIGADGAYEMQGPSGTWDPVTGNQFAEEYTGSFISAPATKSPSGTPECSKTARINLTRLGVVSPKQGGSARESNRMYGVEPDKSFPTNADTTVADLYFDASPANRQYGHRVAALKQGETWYVCDPYYPVLPGGRTQNPIPFDTYKAYMESRGQDFWGAQYPKGNSASSPAVA